jgi:hypothetical protein
MAEYAKGSDMNRALLQGQLLQQGFQQGQGARAQDLAAQQGLGTYQQAMGQAQQGYEQAKLDATQIAADCACLPDLAAFFSSSWPGP